MNSATLERAILAFCRTARVPRSHVSSMDVGGRLFIYVRVVPTEPTGAANAPVLPQLKHGVAAYA